MDLYIVSPLTPMRAALGAAFNTFTTFQDISAAPASVIKGNSFHIGSMLEIEAEGEFSTTVTPTLAIGVFYGAATVNWQSTAVATASGVTALPWHLRWRGLVTALGTSGSMKGQGILDFPTSLTANTPANFPATAAARVVAIDTTVDKTIGIGAAWGTSNAANTITVNSYSALLLN